MLSLKQGLSLSSIKGGSAAAWSPTDESSLQAWFQRGVGIELNGSDVSQWGDSSTNNNHAIQTDSVQQPAYSNGVLTFVNADNNNLDLTSRISFTGEFTIGFKANPSIANICIIGDTGAGTSFDEFLKYTLLTRLSIKIDGSVKHLNLDSGTFGDDYIVITRDSSDVVKLHKNGVLQADTATASGTADINVIGNRDGSRNAFTGTMEEFQFYSDTSTTLTANVNARLASI